MVVRGSFAVQQVVLLCGFTFLLLLSLRSAILAVSAFAVGSSKSHGKAVSYSSAMDPNGVRIFTTGADTGSDLQLQSQCFVSVARATGYDSQLFSSPALCLDISMFNASQNTSHATGLVTAMDGNEQPLLYQFRYDNYHSNLEEDPLEMPSGHFPVLFTTDDEHKYVYVALHPTNGITPTHFGNNNNMKVSPHSMQDYFRHFQHPRYTTLDTIGDMGYSPTVVKYNLETNQQEWKLDFDTTEGKTLITGMAMVPATNRLVVFGSTTGYGMTVGAGAKPNGTNWMGFMTWVDIKSGTIDLSNYRSETHNSHGTPIRSQRNQNDRVLGICLEPGDEKAYVLGSTTGKFEGTQNGGGFVLKLDTDRFDPTWKRQFVGEGVEFTKCAVHGDVVMVGGHVPPGRSLAPRNGQQADINNENENQNWDIVVAALDVSSGATLWIRQIDSHLDDELVSLEKDPNGGVYLTANAWDTDNTSETVFLYALSMDLGGNHDWYQIPSTVDPITGVDSTAPPPVNDNERPRPPNNGSIQTPTTSSTSSDTKDGGSSDMINDHTSIDGRIVTLVPFGIAMAIVTAIAIAYLQKGTTTNTTNITNPESLAPTNTNELRQEEPASMSTTTYDGDFDDVESVASENKLL